MHATMPDHREILHAHLFAGLGGGARGFNRASTRVGTMTATFRCLGGIDVDAAAITDFERLTEADRWRRQAAILRDCAAQAHYSPNACATMLRNAARCDGDAAYWDAGARECEA